MKNTVIVTRIFAIPLNLKIMLAVFSIIVFAPSLHTSNTIMLCHLFLCVANISQRVIVGFTKYKTIIPKLIYNMFN